MERNYVGRPKYSKKKVYKVRRYRRPTYIPRQKFKSSQVYYFKRFCKYSDINVPNISPALGALIFRLDLLPNYTEFTNLYDQYKILGVAVTFLPKQTQSVSIGNVNNADASARIFTAIDYNDVNPPATVDELREYQNAKYTSALRRHTRYIRAPKVQDQGSTYIPGNPWIDTTSPGKYYFGLKYGIEPINSSTTTSMNVGLELTYYLAFKQVK